MAGAVNDLRHELDRAGAGPDDGDALSGQGHMSVIQRGTKLQGGFALTKTGLRRWVLVKVRDAEARSGSDITADQPASVRSRLTWQEVALAGGSAPGLAIPS